MRLKTGIWVVALALACSACASGGPGGPPPGYGDDEDIEGPRPARIQLFISPAGQPFRAPADQPYPVAAWFAQADADHDGHLTRAEFRADAEAWFKVLDANQDGLIDMPEATRWEEELVPELARLSIGGGMVGRREAPRRNELSTRGQGAAAFSLINEPHPVRGADSDLSFSVSPAEWRAAADRRFGLLDVDGDGALALTDLKATPSQGRVKVRRDPRPVIGPRPQGAPR